MSNISDTHRISSWSRGWLLQHHELTKTEERTHHTSPSSYLQLGTFLGNLSTPSCSLVCFQRLMLITQEWIWKHTWWKAFSVSRASSCLEEGATPNFEDNVWPLSYPAFLKRAQVREALGRGGAPSRDGEQLPAAASAVVLFAFPPRTLIVLSSLEEKSVQPTALWKEMGWNRIE